MSVCSSFFPLNAICHVRIYLFVSLFRQKIRCHVLVSYKLELGICLIIPNVSLNFFPAFQNRDATSERCSRKVVDQQNFYNGGQIRRQPPEVFFKKLRSTTLLKKDLAQIFSCEFCEIFKKQFLENTSGRLLLRIRRLERKVHQ